MVLQLTYKYNYKSVLIFILVEDRAEENYPMVDTCSATILPDILKSLLR